MSPTGGIHGSVTRRVGALLGAFVDEHGLGEVFGAETGFRLAEHTLLGADAAFLAQEKWLAVEAPERPVPFAPDLAVEVVSPHDSARQIQDKVDLYLEAGTALVWVIYPDSRKVVVHYPGYSAQTFFEEAVLDGGEMLPGLQIPVTKLFPPQQEQT